MKVFVRWPLVECDFYMDYMVLLGIKVSSIIVWGILAFNEFTDRQSPALKVPMLTESHL